VTSHSLKTQLKNKNKEIKKLKKEIIEITILDNYIKDENEILKQNTTIVVK
jgi:hypothetical protein